MRKFTLQKEPPPTYNVEDDSFAFHQDWSPDIFVHLLWTGFFSLLAIKSLL